MTDRGTNKQTFWNPIWLNHFCRHWNKCMLTIVQNSFYNRHACWLPLINEKFVIDKSVAVAIIFFGLGVPNNAAKPNSVVPTGDHGSSYDGHSSGKLIVILINETLFARKQQSCQKCEHGQSHFIFPNTDSKKFFTRVSLLKRNNSLAKLCFS
jgi:hypothetical protein